MAIPPRLIEVGVSLPMVDEAMVYIGYFAVLEELRGKQIGSQLLEHLKEQYRNYQIAVDIEYADDTTDPNGIKNGAENSTCATGSILQGSVTGSTMLTMRYSQIKER